MKDSLGDRMKMYEGAESDRHFMPLIPIMARLDGSGFSKFTRGMARPYDKRMQDCMIETTKRLVEITNAAMGYTQSDEITLVWFSDSLKNQVWFNGRVTKMIAHLAAKGSVAFNRSVAEHLPEFVDRDPALDARVWQVPNLCEAANNFVWREWDATKNSITMAASAFYTHAELHGKNGKEKIEMLHKKGVNFSDYPAAFKRGTYVQRVVTQAEFTAAEIELLHPKHNARTNPDLVTTRSSVKVIEMPPITKVINRESVIFQGETPIIMAGTEVI